MRKLTVAGILIFQCRTAYKATLTKASSLVCEVGSQSPGTVELDELAAHAATKYWNSDMVPQDPASDLLGVGSQFNTSS
ncbi:hypothetical protein BX600DRAFT_466605 [Xylariales sp. PMI_506]|nr:hypothetical protein BX600DRAFT_466605 [Xylariales sp. PMI_506]